MVFIPPSQSLCVCVWWKKIFGMSVSLAKGSKFSNTILNVRNPKEINHCVG